MTFFPQGSGAAFGPVLLKELASEKLERLDIATAWMRASGLLHLQKKLSEFLASGGKAHVIVGIDADNTSQEGLSGLIALAAGAPADALKCFVRHNEAGPIFHPKMYCFRTKERLNLYVGSNNLTQAGLFQNEELSTLNECKRGEALEKSVDAYIAHLTDPKSGFSHVLDAAFFKKLCDLGYVKSEAVIRNTIQARARKPKPKGERLFASKSVAAPHIAKHAGDVVKAPAYQLPELPVDADWHSVYLRLRQARGTQSQIPVTVVREIRRRFGMTPADGPVDLRSRDDGNIHKVSPARARGNVNTYKFEGTAVEKEPLLHIYPVGNELFFEFLDSAKPMGAKVFKLLSDGLKTTPPATLYSGNDPARATWYRFE